VDFLNKAFLQLKDLLRSMSAGARITAALLLIMVVVSLAYLFRYQMGGPDVYLLNGELFNQEELRAMEVAFGKEGLRGWGFEGPRIRIPRGQQGAFLAALAKNDALPERSGDALLKALNSMNVLMGNQQTQQMFKTAREKEFSKRIKLMPNIQDAFVMSDVDAKRGFGSETIATASVSVTPKGSQALTPEAARTIRNLVASGIAGLKVENVKVVDLNHPGQSFSDGSAGDPSGDDLATHTQVWEQKYRKTIQERLSNITGALVSVSVQLDPTKFSRERVSKVDPKPTAVSTTSKSKTKSQDGSGSGGAAGVIANQPQGLRPAAGKGSHQEEDETFEQTTNTFGSTTTEKDVAGHAPKRVTASVGIPASYFESIWRTRQATGAGTESKKAPQAELDQIRTQEITRIRDAILPLLPRPEGETDTTNLVSVVEFTDIPQEPVAEPGMPERMTNWFTEHWTSLGLVALCLVSLLMLRSMLRAGPAAEEPLRTPVALATGRPVAESPKEETAAERRFKRLSGAGPTLRDELSQLVTEDPETAANILRNWIGNAS
jgi:flagellar M-ring protein FliF